MITQDLNRPENRNQSTNPQGNAQQRTAPGAGLSKEEKALDEQRKQATAQAKAQQAGKPQEPHIRDERANK